MVRQRTQPRSQQRATSRIGTMTEAVTHPQDTVKEYPVSSALVVFGLGMGVGFVLAQALCEPISRAWQPEPTMTERLGRSVYDALHSMLPQSMAKQLTG
jgi:hypothetical protein